MNNLAAYLVKEWEHDRFTVATEPERCLASRLVDLHGLGAALESWLHHRMTPPERDLARFVIDQLTDLDTTEDTTWPTASTVTKPDPTTTPTTGGL